MTPELFTHLNGDYRERACTPPPEAHVRGETFSQSLSPEQLRIHEALCDSQYIAGAKAGWNAGCIPDQNEAQEKFSDLVKSREGHLEGYADARAALAAEKAAEMNDLNERAFARARVAYDRKWADMSSPTPTEEPDAGDGPLGYAIRAYLKGMQFSVTRGWKLVPIEPTPAMKEAGERWSGLPGATWADMLDAAPEMLGAEGESGPAPPSQSNVASAARAFMELFVAENGDERALTVDDIDHAELTHRYAALEAALVGSPAPEAQVMGTRAVQVKPLEWGKTSYGTPEVFSVVGVYRINNAGNGGWTAVANNVDVLRDSDGRTNFPGVDAAKAAAQADYERRILSALASAEVEG